MIDWRLPEMRIGMFFVWRRNLLVWRKLMIPSLLFNFGEPFLYLLGLAWGWAGLWANWAGCRT